MNLSSKEQSILQQIIYSDIFNWPVKDHELRIMNYELREKLLKKKIIGTKNNFYFLQGREYLVKRRLQREKLAKNKFKIARRAAGFLKIVPGILMVGVSGGLAVGNVSQNDDIDFFIVCQNNTLWTSRFFALIILDLFGMRRHPKDKNFQDKICLNMFVDEIGFNNLKKEKDIYTQHELKQLKILWQKTTKPMPNFLEKFLKFIQLKYMSKKITTEKIEEHKLMFHPKDAKKWVLEKYQQKIALVKGL